MTASASKSKAAKAMEAGARAGPQDIALVPIAMSYDRPAEEGALVTELSGIPKEKESLASLLAAAGSLAVGGSKRKATGRKEGGGGGGGREAIGADIMRVGEIVTLERFLMARHSGAPCSQQKMVMTSRMLGEAQGEALALGSTGGRNTTG